MDSTERVEPSSRPAEAKATVADNKNRSQPATERNGTASRSPQRRGKKGNGSKAAEAGMDTTRFFLLKPGSKDAGNWTGRWMTRIRPWSRP